MIPAELKAWRVEKGYSQAQVAVVLGVKEARYNAIECGRVPLPNYLPLFIAALGKAVSISGPESAPAEPKTIADCPFCGAAIEGKGYYAQIGGLAFTRHNNKQEGRDMKKSFFIWKLKK